ncbi:MAG: TRAP transporter small permease [Alphaproteobacteria bacterium]|nr:TRAP transporter small permease [Alphaproteobacteria bacterium]
MNRILGGLCTLHDWLTKAAAFLAAIGLICIVAFYVYEVVTRYMFNAPTAWVSDFVSYFLCASVFLALPKVTKDKGHVAVTILVDIMPDRLKAYFHTVINLIGFACLGFAAIISLQENLRQYSRNIETLAIIPIPQWWVSVFITYGLALSSLYMLRNAPASERDTTSTLAGSAS